MPPGRSHVVTIHVLVPNRYSATQFYRVTLPEALAPKTKLNIIIRFHILSSLTPLPGAIGQAEKQYLQLKFSEYYPSAYETQKQKTKIKFPNVDIPDYSGKPEREGKLFTYGEFKSIPAGAESIQTVRYEFTKSLIHVTKLERDVEVSHWGGNTAFEERYWLTNIGAELSTPFNRANWGGQTFYNAPSIAIKELKVPLKVGSLTPYFTDEIGNVSTSHFRSSKKEALLELKPRYPIFGGWKFPFKLGWDASSHNFVRGVKGDTYILNVPFLEGPNMPEGVSYEKATVRVILPEGAMLVHPFTVVSCFMLTATTEMSNTRLQYP